MLRSRNSIFPDTLSSGRRAVTISATADVERMQLNGSGYTFAGAQIRVDADNDNALAGFLGLLGGVPGIFCNAPGAGTNTLSVNIDIGSSSGSARPLSVEASDTLSFIDGGIISGSADINISGPGQCIFGGGAGNVANTLSGAITIIAGGTLVCAKDAALGTIPAGTTIASGGTLAFQGGITYSLLEPVNCNGVGVGSVGAMLNISGTNTFAGPIVFGALATNIGATAGSLTLTGRITSNILATTVTKVGAGSCIFATAGGLLNAFDALTTVSVGTLVAGADNALGVLGLSVGASVISSGASLGFQGNINYNSTLEPIVVAGVGAGGVGALVNLSGNNVFGGPITLLGNTTIGANDGSLTLSGAIVGTLFGITTAGPGTVTLSSGLNLYTGSTNVPTGTLLVTGNIGLSSGVNLSGGVLGGTGTLPGILGTGGIVSPGLAVGATAALTTGALNLNAATGLKVDINGTTAGTLYDTLNVTGGVNLNNAIFNAVVGSEFTPTVGNAFTLVNNITAGPVVGTFAGLAQDALVDLGNGVSGIISYVGGDGNDIVLLTNVAPVITSNGGGATASISVPENTVLVTVNTATDANLVNILTYSISGGADAAKFTINNLLGTLSFLTPPNFESPTDVGANNVYDVIVQVSDGALTDTQAIAVTVTGLNDNIPEITSNGGGPTASISVAENTSAVATIAATDADAGTTLSYILSGVDADRFTLDSATGVLTFTSAPDFENPTDFDHDNIYGVVVTASDGTFTDSQGLVITVTAVNDNNPIITSNGGGASGSVNVAENTTAVTTVIATDADLPAVALAYSISGADAAMFTINSTSGALAFKSAPNFEAPGDAGGDNVYNFTITASDGALTDTQTFAVTVTAVNDNSPVITSNGGGASGSASVAENIAAVTTVTATDADLPAVALTYSISGTDAAKFTINPATGVVVFITAPDFEIPTDAGGDNAYNFVVTASDGTLTDAQSFTLTVTPVNDNNPVITSNGGGSSGAINVPDHTTAVATVTATDADLPAQSLTYSISGADASKFTINTSTGVVSFISPPDVAAPTDAGGNNVYDVIVQVSDGSVTDTQAIAVTVTSVNSAPSDVSLSVNSVVEGQAIGTTVGAFNSTDADAGGTFTYTLVGGAGSTDNASFTIDGSGNLKTAAVFNAATKNSYAIRVRTTDQGGLSIEKQFTVTVTSANVAPTDITLSSSSILELLASGSTVGTFSTVDANVGNTFVYTLVSGTGSADNASFTIDASGNLKTASIFNFLLQSSFSIRVRSTDQGGLSFEKIFVIGVLSANVAPSDISLSASAVAENQPVGTTVGTLSGIDSNPGSTFTYALVSGVGSTDNASFTIDASGNIKTAAIFNFEGQNTFSIRVRATDSGGLSVDKVFTIGVTNTSEAPTDMSLAVSAVAEHSPIGTTVGTVVVSDPDGGAFTYALVSGAGGADNASFTIDASGNIKTAAPLDFADKSSYSIRVRATDSDGLSFEKQFTISVTNVNDAPTDVALTATSIAEGLPAGSTVGTLSTTDADTSDTYTYTLVSGTGSTDNASFTIDATGHLKTASVFTFATKSSYAIRVRSTDQGGLSYEKQFTISVLDLNINQPPTDVSLSVASIPEGSPIGTTVGTFNTADVNSGSSFTYALVAGTGSTDNASFTIDASGHLQAAAVFNFNTKSNYSIRVRTTDQGGLSLEKIFTISVTNVNDAPTDIGLSTTSIGEGLVAGTTTGAFNTSDPDAGGTFTYTLVGGVGSTDNGSFLIDASGNLKSAIVFNAATKSVYAIRVRSTDQGGLSTEKTFTIDIVPAGGINSTPTDITLSLTHIAENQAIGTIVGTLGTIDTPGNAFVYTLVAGTGSTNNSSFTIDAQGKLRAAEVFNFETKSSYNIRIRSTDQGGLSVEKAFVIVIDDVNDLPTGLSLSASDIAENQPAGTLVGTFSSADPDPGNTFTYQLVTGTGSTDNASFTVDSSGHLRTSAPFDFETKSTYSIRVRTTDQASGAFDKVFTIHVTDVAEAPANLGLTSTNVLQHQPAGTTVGDFVATGDVGDVFTFALVPGIGSTDNNAFTISENHFKSAGEFDAGIKDSYSIRVRVTDQGGLSSEKTFTISVVTISLLLAPTDIFLSASHIAENLPASTIVGALTTADSPGDTFTFTLVGGAGSDDNASFFIDGQGNLKSLTSLNFEAKSNYLVRVRSADQGGLFIEKAFVITVDDANDSPTDVNLSPSTVAENQPVGTLVGSLATTDPDVSNTFTYALIAGSGDGDNASFTLDAAGQLRTAASFNFETRNSYTIRVRTTDQSSASFEKVLTVGVTDVTEGPSDITLSNATISEDLPAGDGVGTLGAQGDAGSTFIFALVAGEGSADNASFAITGTSLRTTVAFDAETRSTYLIRVRAADQNGLFIEKSFTIHITSGVETAPTLTAIAPMPGATEDTPFTISYDALAAASNAADTGGTTLYFLIETVDNGVIVSGGTPVTPGVTLLGPGESAVWTPALNSNGNIIAFSVKAFDGALASSNAVPVTVVVAPVNDAPTLTTVSTLSGALQNNAFTIDYATLASAADEADVDGTTPSFRIESVVSGTLTKDGVAVVPGTTLLGPGEHLVWSPASNTSGTIAAFTVTAFDGIASSGTPVTVSADVAIRYTHDLTPGLNRKFSFSDSAGQKITVKLGGKTGVVHLVRAVPDSQSGDLLTVTSEGTTAKSKISITTRPRRATNVIDILVNGPLGTFNAKAANVLGDATFTGAVAKVRLGDFLSDPTLTLAGTAADKPAKIRLGRATGLTLHSENTIKSLTLIDWNGGSLTAPAITDFKTTGRKRLSAGDLNAHVTLTRTSTDLPALHNLNVRGAFIHSELSSAGRVDSITVGTLIDTNVYIGTTVGVTGLATSGAQFTTSHGSLPDLGRLTIKVLSNQPSYVDSVIDACVIGTLKLKIIATDNGGTPLGVAADRIDSISFIAAGFNGGKFVTLTDLDVPADLNNPVKNPNHFAFPAHDLKLVLVTPNLGGSAA